ncbi:ABC transporter ATP-binding protein [Microbacterium sp. MYb62]|uniref:ABC transporter ATP-binding protein n=1 Tax=Microbacterium sp. MYb62 TaxID=1848690 RepID=UPI000CFBD153|nr:ABC transporter ATP-binding protein [Microbacterium sp. MYb62]PRB14854.1 ABC transporter ATP-binding protein [Microbacterium sp. MYb62]
MTIAFHGVDVARGDRTVLHGIDLTIDSGRIVGLIGPNGSGKSTLLRTLFSGRRPLRGRVTVDGADVADFAPRALARTVSVMLQDAPSEFDLTVRETVLVGRAPHRAPFTRDSPDDHRIVDESLRAADVADLGERLMRQLSGGQRQRVMLARALAQDGEILILDEPTNHLDISHQLDLMRVVSGLGKTVVAALHDLNIAASFCDDIAVLDEGRLVAFGHPAAVLTPELVSDVFQVTARVAFEEGTGARAMTFHPRPPVDGTRSSTPARRTE